MSETQRSPITDGDKPWLFKPGRSGNPGGRPKGLMTTARRLTRDGHDLAQFMWMVFRGGQLKGSVGPAGRPVVPTLDQRMEAANWLADRGFGKPAQTLQLATKRQTIFELPDGTVLTPPPPIALPTPSDADDSG